MRAKLLFCRKEASELIVWLLENRVTALQARREAASPPASGKRASAEAAPASAPPTGTAHQLARRDHL